MSACGGRRIHMSARLTALKWPNLTDGCGNGVCIIMQSSLVFGLLREKELKKKGLRTGPRCILLALKADRFFAVLTRADEAKKGSSSCYGKMCTRNSLSLSMKVSAKSLSFFLPDLIYMSEFCVLPVMFLLPSFLSCAGTGL